MPTRLRLSVLVLAAVLVAGCGRAPTPASAPAPDGRPNILLILTDDLGYADLGAYGGDIRTPNIDGLATEGVLFTQFHASPMCAPTRAMLLSGNNNHVAGVGRMHAAGLVNAHLPGYENHLSDRIAPLPRLLRDGGYHTYMVGKWHLGDAPEHSPAAAGFERSFSLLRAAGNHFNDVGFENAPSRYREDDEEVPWPAGAFSSELYTDRLITYIDANRSDGRPFFAYAAYTAPHWPLQVPDEDLNLYAGRYDRGYDALREERFRSLKAAGVIPEGSRLPPRNGAIAPWEALTSERRREESRKMELYAALVENLDRHIGRLLDHLRSSGVYENTLIIFASDNGAAGEDFYNAGQFQAYLREHYDNAYENMGRASSFVSYGPQWAEAGSAPFSRYKGHTREGGMVAPMIAAGAGVVPRGAIERAYVTVMDIAPTLLDVAGVAYPSDGSVRPMLGETMWPLLRGEAAEVHGPTYVTTLYHWGLAFVRQGRWKLVTMTAPFDPSAFQLFDLEADPGETTDLSKTDPQRFQALLRLWNEHRLQLGIVLPGDL
jgi:arylsulfatase